jgi:hypothetical protein
MMVVLEDAASYGPKTGLVLDEPVEKHCLRCGQIIDDVCGGFLRNRRSHRSVLRMIGARQSK